METKETEKPTLGSPPGLADAPKKKDVKPPLQGWRKIKLLKDGYGGLNYPQGSVIETREDEATFAVQSGRAIYADDLAEVTNAADLKPDAESEKERHDKTAKAIADADKAAMAEKQKPSASPAAPAPTPAPTPHPTGSGAGASQKK